MSDNGFCNPVNFLSAGWAFDNEEAVNSQARLEMVGGSRPHNNSAYIP